MAKQLITIRLLSEQSGIPVRTLRTLKTQRKIPYIRAGYRTLLFDLEKVMAALEKMEVKAVA